MEGAVPTGSLRLLSLSVQSNYFARLILDQHLAYSDLVDCPIGALLD